jgi:hypothetical protein
MALDILRAYYVSWLYLGQTDVARTQYAKCPFWSASWGWASNMWRLPIANKLNKKCITLVSYWCTIMHGEQYIKNSICLQDLCCVSNYFPFILLCVSLFGHFTQLLVFPYSRWGTSMLVLFWGVLIILSIRWLIFTFDAHCTSQSQWQLLCLLLRLQEWMNT